ncbi:hypothetical protein H5410_049999 [Solanum commersonii]|uniref:DUF4283 domain-containing protein n=1 Tax=Solanum commersonii TaxID=4109 RepID=A0A9J5WWB9_SOLCO|nr:hypothetical protein H5410_049999 [Solanum commersonii]
MATMLVGQPPSGEVAPHTNQSLPYTALNFLGALRPDITKSTPSIPLTLKYVAYLHGEPRVIWEEEEVEQMIINENLQYAILGKFSYGWPEIQELRSLIPKQCNLKGECKIATNGMPEDPNSEEVSVLRNKEEEEEMEENIKSIGKEADLSPK